MTAATEALRQCIEAMKLVDFKDCGESEALWHQHGLALANAERVLREGEKQEPFGYVAVQAGYDTGTVFNTSRVVSKETAEACAKQWRPQNRDYRVEVFPVYRHPAPSLQAVVEVPEGWQLVPKKPTAQMIEAAAKADDEGFEAGRSHGASGREIYDAMLDAAPPTAAPVATEQSLASFYLAEDGLTCTHEGGDFALPLWCKDSADAYNAMRIISTLHDRANRAAPVSAAELQWQSIPGGLQKLVLPAAAPSGDAMPVSVRALADNLLIAVDNLGHAEGGLEGLDQLHAAARHLRRGLGE